MKYMIIHYIDEGILNGAEDGDVEANAAAERQLNALDEELEARGILVGGGVLDAPRSGATVRVRDGEVLIADGPFAETKEQIAGYSVLECSDLAQAIEVTSRHPTARFGILEVRPYLSSAHMVTATDAVDGEAGALRHFLD
jgi:hypothetical protein